MNLKRGIELQYRFLKVSSRLAIGKGFRQSKDENPLNYPGNKSTLKHESETAIFNLKVTELILIGGWRRHAFSANLNKWSKLIISKT